MMKDPRLDVVLLLGRNRKRVDCVPMTGLVSLNWAAGYTAGFITPRLIVLFTREPFNIAFPTVDCRYGD